MSLLRIEEYLASGRYLQAQREAERIIQDPDASPGMRAGAMLHGTLAALELGDYYAAVRWAEGALEWGLLEQEWETIGLSRFRLGCALHRIGDWQNSAEHLQTFLNELDRYPAHRRCQGIALYNLGLACAAQHRVDEALRYYDLAFDWAAQVGDTVYKLRSLHNSAWLLLLEHRMEQARQYLSRAAALLPAVGPEGQVHQLCHEALYQRMSGRYAESLALCEEVFAPEREGVTPHHRAEAAWIAGENALDLGQVQQAKIFSNLATQYAMEARWSRLLNLVGRLRRRIHQQEVEMSAGP